MNFKETVTPNIELKLLALLIALLLWLNVNHGGDSQVDVKVPVRIINTPPHLHLELVEPAAAELRITGPKILLWQLDKERIAIYLDASGVGEGRTAFTVLEKGVALPRSFQVVRVSPSSVTVKMTKAEPSFPLEH